MARNGHFSATQSAQKSTFTDTVLTDETITVSISQSQGSVGQHAETTNGNIDAVDPDIFALVLRIRAQLEGVDGHEELFIGHGIVGLVEQTRGFIGDGLHLLLLLFGTDLALGLLELLAVDTRFDLARVGGLQVDIPTGQTEGGGHVPLRADMDGLVELLGAERQLPLLGVDAIGRAQRGDILVYQVADSIRILGGEVPGSRNEKLRDGIGSFSDWGRSISILDKSL